MAQGLFSAQVITTTGLTPTLSAVSASGDLFSNSGKEFIRIANGGASDRTLTVKSQHKCDFGSAHDITVVIPAGSTKYIGYFPVKWYSNGSDKVEMNYSNSGADLTAGIFRF